MLKIEHNIALYGSEASTQSFEVLKESFQNTYEQYRRLREELHERESAGIAKQDSFLNQLVAVKEELSKIIFRVYESSSSLEEFGDHLKDIVAYSGNVSLKDVETYILGAYIYPPSLNKKNLRSPIESIYSTYENLKIVTEFLDIGKKHSDGIILSGTNSWGAFHAVWGKNPARLVGIGMKQKEFDSMSDIDFLITCETQDQLETILKDYISSGIINSHELVRLNLFKKLLKSGKAEIFSVRAYYGGIEESIHFIFNKTILKVTTDSLERSEEGIGFVKDFRPNIPGNVKKYGGYPTYDVLGMEKKMFDPHLKKLYAEGKKEIIGYISRMPAGGFAELNKRRTYFIGLLSFYLLVAPTILFDRDGALHDRINEIRKRVKGVLGDELPRYIPQEEKMARAVLQRIKESFIEKSL